MSNRGSVSEPINAVPSVLRLLCDRELHREAAGNVMYVMPTTRQIINSDVLVALKIEEGMPTLPADFDTAEDIAHALNERYQAERVTLPHGSRCSFTESESPSASMAQLRLEISQPFINPFSRDGDRVTIFVVRLSLDGQAESWYSAEVEHRGNGWTAIRAVRLPIDD